MIAMTTTSSISVKPRFRWVTLLRGRTMVEGRSFKEVMRGERPESPDRRWTVPPWQTSRRYSRRVSKGLWRTVCGTIVRVGQRGRRSAFVRRRRFFRRPSARRRPNWGAGVGRLLDRGRSHGHGTRQIRGRRGKSILRGFFCDSEAILSLGGPCQVSSGLGAEFTRNDDETRSGNWPIEANWRVDFVGVKSCCGEGCGVRLMASKPRIKPKRSRDDGGR